MHYKNGRPAKVGDPVVGTTFNYTAPGCTIAGTLVTCTPGPDSCNAEVGMLITVMADAEGNLPIGNPMIHGKQVYSATPVTVQGTEQHGSSGRKAITYYVEDYTECKHLLHAEDAAQAAQPMEAFIEAIDYGSLIEQNKKANEECRGISGKGAEWEDGYIKAHDDIKDLIINAQEHLKLEPGDLSPDCGIRPGNAIKYEREPPIDNDHVAEGCEQFVGSKAD